MARNNMVRVAPDLGKASPRSAIGWTVATTWNGWWIW